MHDSLKKIHKLMLKIVKINSQTHMNHTKAPQAMEDVRYKRRSGSPWNHETGSTWVQGYVISIKTN